MKWNELLRIVGKEPVFHSSLLRVGLIDPIDLGRQLSRWVKSGKLIQIRRSLYALSEQYRKTTPHLFFVANSLKKGSYISLQSALEYHGLIPEYVPTVMSVTTGRPETLSTPLGTFSFRHIKKDLFFGYEIINFKDDQLVSIATPEKALLDLIYLTPGSDNFDYLRELRLQNLDTINVVHMKNLSFQTKSQKLQRALRLLDLIFKEEN
ncbi:hypothetical protein ACFLRX_06090 [Acidobacteriota bacterium]